MPQLQTATDQRDLVRALYHLTQEAFLSRYRSLVDALLDSPALTDFCYTQLADTLQEQNGLATAARQPKIPADLVWAVNCRTSAAVPADAIGAFEFGDYPAPPGDRVQQTGQSERRPGGR